MCIIHIYIYIIYMTVYPMGPIYHCWVCVCVVEINPTAHNVPPDAGA